MHSSSLIFRAFTLITVIKPYDITAERRRLRTRPIQLMTRGSKAPWRELELIPFQPLKKLISLKMMLLFNSSTLRVRLSSHFYIYIRISRSLFMLLMIVPFNVSTVQASIAANTWVVSGSPQTKSNASDNLFISIFLFLLHCIFSD